MPITIQEIIASDTISQLVDKTNFNFDQLLLNGGGPAGTTGVAGPTGPNGGRGPKGSTWYDDASTTAPGVSPNVTAPTATPLSGDYYLQFNGRVWEYNGTTWVITTVDLQGPTGAAGTTGGFSLAYGQGNINNINSYYPAPNGLSAGATTTNQGVMSVMMGGVVSNTVPIDASIPLTNAYIIPDVISTAMASDVLSVLIHQRDSAATAIKFHGGNSISSENYEQASLGNLSGIQLGADDRLRMVVPKAATSPTAQADLIGYEVSTAQRAQYYSAGQSIEFATGLEGTQQFAGQHSNFEIAVGNGATSNAGNKYKMATSGTDSTTLTEAGNVNTVTLLNTSTLVGNWQAVAGTIRLVSSFNTEVYSGRTIRLETTTNTAAGAIILKTLSGGMQLTSVGGPITIQQTDATATAPINITNNDNNINLTTTVDGEINSSVAAAGEITNTVAVNAGIDNVYKLTSSGISLTTKTGNALTNIQAFGSGGNINLEVLAADGKIEIGSAATSVATNFNYFGGGPELSMINTRGRTNWNLTGNGIVATGTTIESYRQINAVDISSGNTITQTGLKTLAVSPGVAHAGFIDGNSDPKLGTSVYIAKPNYYQAGSTFAPENAMGIFINSDAEFLQGPATSSNANSLYPTREDFSVTGGADATTKISNRLLYGGKNGVQTVYVDPLRAGISTTENITVTSPYLRIVVGSDARGGGVYTEASLAANQIASRLAYTINFNIIIDATANSWIEGQHVYVELINSNATIIINKSNNTEVLLRQYGTVNVNYAVYKNVGGTTVFSQPGVQSGIEKSLQAVTPNPILISNTPGQVTTVTQSGELQLRGSDVDKVQIRFVAGGQSSGTNVVSTGTLPLYWGLSGKVISSETYSQVYPAS